MQPCWRHGLQVRVLRDHAGHGISGGRASRSVIALVVAFGLSLAPDQIGAILAVTAVVLGLITQSRVSPATAAPQ